jgi:hypothetical protein
VKSSNITLAALATLLAGACGGSRVLRDSGGAGAGTDPTGAAGAGGSAPGAAGAAAGGASGAAAISDEPLRIPGAQAIDRIAQFLWLASSPDAPESLRGASYVTVGDLAPAVDAILSDPRAAVGVGKLFRVWLYLDDILLISKDPAVFPELTPELRSAIQSETVTFGVKVTLDMNGTLETLLTADFSFVNEPLSHLYGIDGVVGNDLRMVPLPAGRLGILTQPALQYVGSLPTRNSPLRRGAQLDWQLFCRDTETPPPSNPPVLDPPPPGTSLRQALSQISPSATCDACHTIDGDLGFPFEGFDAIGRARSTDNGAPVDTTAMLPTGEKVDGAVALARVLAHDDDVASCVAQKWLSLAVAMTSPNPTIPPDSASITEVTNAFTASGHNLKALLRAVVLSDRFLAPLMSPTP